MPTLCDSTDSGGLDSTLVPEAVSLSDADTVLEHDAEEVNMIDTSLVPEVVHPNNMDTDLYKEVVKETVLANNALCFSEGEYQRRMNGLIEQMEQRKIDVLITNSPATVFYLTGYQTTGYGHLQPLVISLDNEPFMMTRYLESFNVYARTWIKKNYIYTDTQLPLDVLKSALIDNGMTNKTIAYESTCHYLPKNFVDFCSQLSPASRVVDGSGLVEQLRLIKSDEEIKLMRRAAKISEKAMLAGLNATEYGESENAIAAEVCREMFSQGGEYPSVMPYITSGPRCLIGHATWENRTLDHDECVFIELAGCLKRYHTAMMRTIYIGKPPQAVMDAHAIVDEALRTAMEVLKPGVRVCDADRAIRNVTKKIHHTGGKMVSRSGYSIGIAFAPSWDEGHILSLTDKDERLLEENMTLHIIPWVHGIEAKHVMALSETVCIQKEGAQSFFNLPRDLIVR